MRLREDPHLALFFLLGRDQNSSVHVSPAFWFYQSSTEWSFIIEETILAEAHTSNDVLIEDFQDTYRNLTLKSTFMLKWLNNECSKARFAFKVGITNDNNNDDSIW